MSPGEVAENTTVVAVLTGECRQASVEAVVIDGRASLNKDLIEVRLVLETGSCRALCLVYNYIVYYFPDILFSKYW